MRFVPYTSHQLAFYALIRICNKFTNRMSTLPDVGKCFQALRKASGRTQVEIAQATGMRQEALSRFERGRGSDFSMAKMLRLLQTLGLEMSFQPVTARPTLESVLEERRAGGNTGPDAR